MEYKLKKIDLSGKSESFVLFTNSAPEAPFPFVLPKNWNVGDSIKRDFIDLDYQGMSKKIVNGKNIKVYELGGKNFDEIEGGIIEMSLTNLYETKTGMLVSFIMKLTMANVLLGSGSILISLEAVDISEPPLIDIVIEETKKASGGCLIATATYGSELSPQVQQLRELRDNSLLQTESGSAFMKSFNQFYYSFSPSIADFERENPIFKEAVKLTITPLLSSLSLLNYVDMESEVEVLTYGISLILLNIGMYVVAPIGIVVLVRRKI